MVSGPQSPKEIERFWEQIHTGLTQIQAFSLWPVRENCPSVTEAPGSTLFIADISAGSENTVLAREIYVRPETGQRKVVSVIFIPAE